MRYLFSLYFIGLFFCLSAQETVTYPYNPDGNDDGVVTVPDLQDMLSFYGNDFIPGEIMIGDTGLSQWVHILLQTLLAQQELIDSLSVSDTNNSDFIQSPIDVSEVVSCEDINGIKAGTIVHDLHSGTLRMVVNGIACGSGGNNVWLETYNCSGSGGLCNYWNSNLPLAHYKWCFSVSDTIVISSWSTPCVGTSSIVRIDDLNGDAYDPNIHFSYNSLGVYSENVLFPGQTYCWTVNNSSCSESLRPIDTSVFNNLGIWVSNDGELWGASNTFAAVPAGFNYWDFGKKLITLNFN